MFKVDFMVKGASRIITKEYATEVEANAAADRWRRSNSIGSYVAHVEKVIQTPFGPALSEGEVAEFERHEKQNELLERFQNDDPSVTMRVRGSRKEGYNS